MGNQRKGGSTHLSQALELDSFMLVAVSAFEESSYTLDMRRHICLSPLFMSHISILEAAEHLNARVSGANNRGPNSLCLLGLVNGGGGREWNGGRLTRLWHEQMSSTFRHRLSQLCVWMLPAAMDLSDVCK